jgi:hypothetical protein
LTYTPALPGYKLVKDALVLITTGQGQTAWIQTPFNSPL